MYGTGVGVQFQQGLTFFFALDKSEKLKKLSLDCYAFIKDSIQYRQKNCSKNKLSSSTATNKFTNTQSLYYRTGKIKFYTKTHPTPDTSSHGCGFGVFVNRSEIFIK